MPLAAMLVAGFDRRSLRASRPQGRGRGQPIALGRAALYRVGERLLPRRRHRRAAGDERNLERHGGAACHQPDPGDRRRHLGRLLQFAQQGPADRRLDVAGDQPLCPLPHDPARISGASSGSPPTSRGARSRSPPAAPSCSTSWRRSSRLAASRSPTSSSNTFRSARCRLRSRPARSTPR